MGRGARLNKVIELLESGQPVFCAAVAQNGALPCGSSEKKVTLTWTTTNATSVSITRGSSPLGSFPADGSTHVCLPPSLPQAYTLVAQGPGGSSAPAVQTA